MRQLVTVLVLLSMSVVFTACLGGEDVSEETAPAAEETTVEPEVPAAVEPATEEAASDEAASEEAAVSDAAEEATKALE